MNAVSAIMAQIGSVQAGQAVCFPVAISISTECWKPKAGRGMEAEFTELLPNLHALALHKVPMLLTFARALSFPMKRISNRVYAVVSKG